MSAPLWLSNLLYWSAQVALLTLVAAFLPRLFGLRQPRVLLPYWRLLLAVSLLLPVIEPWRPLASIATPSLITDAPAPAAVPHAIPAASRWHFPGGDVLAQLLGIVVLAGIAVRFLLLSLGLLKLRRLRRASSTIPASAACASVLEQMRALVSARAEFRVSAEVESPVTFGFASPVVLLPERFLSLEPRFQSAIACHELLHVRRHDWAHHLGEELLRATFWFHPAIAWLISRVRLAREQVVDLNVVRITQAPKPYLQALLEFTDTHARLAAIPAPPFLAKRQLVERVTLMLKEVRMSRTRLIVSLAAVSACLALAVIFAVWTFPLEAAPRAAQSAPSRGILGGIPGGVAGGVRGGVADGTTGGVSDGLARGVVGGVADGRPGGVRNEPGGKAPTGSRLDEPKVDYSTIWIDTVKRGAMVRQFRGLGTLVREEGSGNLIARVVLPDVMAAEVHPEQGATVDTHAGLVKGHVRSLGSSASSAKTRTVDISLDSALPHGAAAGLSIDGMMEIERLNDVLQVGRPVHASQNSTVSVFKIVSDTEAVRVNVKLGRSSATAIEVLDGLKEGDRVILSDMSSVDNANRVRLTDEKPLLKH